PWLAPALARAAALLVLAHRLRRRRDQARFLALLLFLCGENSAQAGADELLEERDAFQVGAVAKTRGGGRRPSRRGAAAGAREIVGGILETAARERGAVARQQSGDRAIDDRADSVLLLKAIEHQR